MTVYLERPVRSMVDQHSLVDPYDEPHAKIRIDVVVSRDHLAAAVDMGVHKYYGDGRTGDDLTVEEVRYFAEAYVLSESALGAQQGAEAMAALLDEDFHEEVTRAHIAASYRAVDRAYPAALK
ncbi:hypothetical protein AB0D14_01930 [Streptomyces sp. NPDC048484]|uniref:hypothetical protein n=1 Tax=Streptomyces sp. NPDC048484 TaxID=3155146 RepID=UPI0034396C20